MSPQARRTSTSTASVPSLPRPSASLLLVNHNGEVLMIQRTLATNNFAGIHAFPGGNFDPSQDADFRMTALRETFEESGILLVEPNTTTTTTTTTTTKSNTTTPTPAQLAAARRAIHSRSHPLTFPAFLARHHLAPPPPDRLVPFSEWTTPPRASVRFHTRFYVLFTDALAFESALESESDPNSESDSDSDSDSEARAHQDPTADGGVEVTSASWIRPRDVLAAFRRAEISLFPPQYYLLTTLADLLDAMHRGRNHSRNHNRTEALRSSIGCFGSRQFNPRPMGFTEQGGMGQRLILTYEGDELRGGKARDRHRCLVRYQGPRIADIELQRNIDVFTPLDSKPKL